MMLCYCVLHVLRYSVHWNCCTEEMPSLLDFLEVEGGLARKRRFHVFNFWNLKEASHESFVFISATTGIWKTPRTKASFSSLQLLGFEGGLARKLRFHLCNYWNLKDASHESFVFISSTLGIWRKPRTKAAFSFLQLLEFERRLARKRRFQFFNSWNLKEASHESFVFISATTGIWKTPRTKASFSSLQLLGFEGSLARKLRFHFFNSWNLKEASHESFVFISATLGIWKKSRTKACDLQFNVCRSRSWWQLHA